MQQPRYKESNKDLLFLGQWKQYDLYYQSPGMLIVRWGDEGEPPANPIASCGAEYGKIYTNWLSVSQFMPDMIVALTEAYKRRYYEPSISPASTAQWSTGMNP